MGQYYEELEVGTVFETPKRTITEADIVLYAGITGDYNPYSMDEEFAKTTSYGTRILQDQAGFVIAIGLESRIGFKEGTAIAFLGMDWEFKHPIYLNDTVHVVETIISKRETSKPNRGIICSNIKLVNQNGVVCQEGEWIVMMERKIFSLEGVET